MCRHQIAARSIRVNSSFVKPTVVPHYEVPSLSSYGLGVFLISPSVSVSVLHDCIDCTVLNDCIYVYTVLSDCAYLNKKSFLHTDCLSSLDVVYLLYWLPPAPVLCITVLLLSRASVISDYWPVTVLNP